MRAHTKEATAGKAPTPVVKNTLPQLKPVPVEEPPAPPSKARSRVAPGGPAVGEPPEESPEQALHRRRLNGALSQKAGGEQGAPPGGGQGPLVMASAARGPGRGVVPAMYGLGGQQGEEGGGERGGDLAQKLEPLRLTLAEAGHLKEREYLITQGTMVDCVLETRIVSSVPGMTSCYLTRDVYSTNGRVVLLDRGSKVVGHYQGGMSQGQARIFVVWSRVETPKGVVVNLDSPGTGPLGEAGAGGWIDTHFWQRFGGAILLSVIDDLAASATVALSRYGNNNNVSVTNTSQTAQEMAAKALESTIGIPPTLYKNQGERVGIFVARDLDFRGVYGLEPQ
jgi:type IV secretion system protein VirB10